MSKELTEKYTPIVKETGVFELVEVRALNHSPHPFMIGPRHFKNASMYLDQAALRSAPCAMRGCGLPYDDHTHDTVALVRLTKDANDATAQAALKQVVDADIEADGIDGFVFIQSDFNFVR